MQQFGPQFINYHLMPLLEEMLTDTVQRKKDYLDKLFITGVLEDQEKKNLMDYYFNPARKNQGVPFTGPENQKERENFLKHFVEYVRSRGAKPEDRVRAFLPVANQKSEGPEKAVVWPAEVKRNLFLMSYTIAENFEKDKLNELILAKEAEGKTEEAKKDRELLEKGMLMLVKDPATGDYTRYIRADELKAGQTETQFAPPPPPETEEFMKQGFAVPSQQNIQSIAQGATSPQAVASASSYEAKPVETITEQPSSNDELTKSFQQKRGRAIVNQLQKMGMQIIGDVQFDANGHVMVKVKSGGDTLLVSADVRVPFDQQLKFTFTFQDGPSAGKSFTVDEARLTEAFLKADGTFRTARDLYADIDLSKKLGIKSDAYPEKAPAKPQPLPLPGGVGKPQEPGAKEPFKVPTGVEGMPKPLKAKMKVEGEGGEGGFVLPTGVKAPPVPKAGPGEEKKEGVGIKIKIKPVPGIPVGSVMEAKARLKQQQEEEEQKRVVAAAAAQLQPVAPGRVGVAPPAIAKQKPKSNFGRIALIANLGGIGTAVGGGFMLAGDNPSTAPDLALNIVKNVLIAIVHFPNMFG